MGAGETVIPPLIIDIKCRGLRSLGQYRTLAQPVWLIPPHNFS